MYCSVKCKLTFQHHEYNEKGKINLYIFHKLKNQDEKSFNQPSSYQFVY